MTNSTLSRHIVPSVLERTKACPASPRIIEEYRMAPTSADIAGQMCHAVAVAYVHHALDPNYTDEMLDATIEQVYVADYKAPKGTMANVVSTAKRCAEEVIRTYQVMGPGTTWMAEQPMEIPTHFKETITCRPDFVLINNKIAHIIELKYGQNKGDNRDQMYAYALAVCYQNKEIEKVHMTVYPSHRLTHTLTAKEVYEWSIGVFGPALTAVLADDAKAQPGNHCMNCPAAYVCGARMKWMVSMAEKNPAIISDEELDGVLRMFYNHKDLWAGLVDVALERLNDGRKVGDWSIGKDGGPERWAEEVPGDNARKLLVHLCERYGVEPDELFTRLTAPSIVREKYPGLWKALKSNGMVRQKHGQRLLRPADMRGEPVAKAAEATTTTKGRRTA